MSARKSGILTAAVAACLTLAACEDEPSPGSDASVSSDGSVASDGSVGADASLGPDAGSDPATRLNILLLIADDLGLDVSAQYGVGQDLPSTPTLDALAADGIVFDNAWATPACTTTRGTIISGKHGVHSGVTFVPAVLPDGTQTLQSFLQSSPQTATYANALFGKWHLGGNAPPATHPESFGVQHYAGNLAGTLADYYEWPLTTAGVTSTESTYHTTKITDLAVDWVGQQQQPWFLWMAYVAPHSPFHLPPAHLHSRELSGTAEDIAANQREYYLAAIEAMDSEIGRLLNSLDAETRDNTIIVFVGDNGTPRPVIDRSVFVGTHGKNSLYEGGVRVPLIVAGAPVARKNIRESALVNTTDFFATFATLAGQDTPGVHDSQSFAHLIVGGDGGTNRTHNYVEFESADVTGWATRNARYKLITFADGRQELYDVIDDLGEQNDLLQGGQDFTAVVAELEAAAEAVRGSTSGEPVDITNASFSSRNQNCEEHVARYRSSVTDVARGLDFEGSVAISVANGKCVLSSNAIPNHDFNDGARPFPNQVSEQNARFEITAQPTFANALTMLSLVTDNAFLLNGVKVDLLAAGCFGVGNGRIGCNDITQPWRYDPMHGANGFTVDSHNAHTQPDGTYHYHGHPKALFDDSSASESPLIGFAADGFPIFGSYFNDGTQIRKATPSYRLRAGARPNTAGSPGGSYDGAFRDDYEYVEGLGDLDECNGMTVDGVYGYYVTDAFPYVVGCFKGTPDASFDKR